MKISISATRQETLFGYIYLAFSQLLLPDLIVITAHFLGFSITIAVLNIVYFLVNFVAIVAIFHRFLRISLCSARKKLWQCLRSSVLGFGLYYIGTLLLGLVIPLIDPDFSNINDDAIAGFAQEHSKLIAFCTIFLVPVVEETLYRGLIFQHLQRKHRLLGYCVSTAAFSAIHILSFLGSADWATLVLCFIQYVPAGIALAWAYEKADNIFVPIFIHMTINQIGMSTLR